MYHIGLGRVWTSAASTDVDEVSAPQRLLSWRKGQMGSQLLEFAVQWKSQRVNVTFPVQFAWPEEGDGEVRKSVYVVTVRSSGPKHRQRHEQSLEAELGEPPRGTGSWDGMGVTGEQNLQ